MNSAFLSSCSWKYVTHFLGTEYGGLAMTPSPNRVLKADVKIRWSLQVSAGHKYPVLSPAMQMGAVRVASITMASVLACRQRNSSAGQALLKVHKTKGVGNTCRQ